MKKQPDADRLAVELAAARALIDAHPNIQQLIDLAADEADRRAVEIERSRRLAWRVAGTFGATAFAAVLVAGGAVATAMRPSAPPEVLVVNKVDGSSQRLTSLVEFQTNPEEATIRRNVSTFVSAREGWPSPVLTDTSDRYDVTIGGNACHVNEGSFQKSLSAKRSS